jgi:hypothetical protein
LPSSLDANLYLNVRNPKIEKNAVSRIASESELKKEFGFQFNEDFEEKAKIESFGKFELNRRI